jgi:hypothetical protein
MATFTLALPFQALDVFALAVLTITLFMTTWVISIHRKYALRVFVLVNAVLMMVQPIFFTYPEQDFFNFAIRKRRGKKREERERGRKEKRKEKERRKN